MHSFKNSCCALTTLQNGYFSLLLAAGKRVFFLGLQSENLVETLDIKLEKTWGGALPG